MAGVAYILRDLMNKYLPGVMARTLGPDARYGDGRNWETKPDGQYRRMADAVRLVKWADVLVLHNGSAPPGGRLGKKRLCYYHSEPWNVNRSEEKAGAAAYTLAQYHATLYNLPVIPNIVDIHAPLMQPVKRIDPAGCVFVGYSPSTRRPRTKQNPWNSKGWDVTKPVLDRLDARGNVKAVILEGTPFRQCMDLRRRCHIVIDEVVTGSYHRCSLEASSHGQVVINGLSPAVRKVLEHVTGKATVPWLVSSGDALEDTLIGLLDKRNLLGDIGADSRAWMEEHWDPAALLKRFWLPALESAPGGPATPGKPTVPKNSRRGKGHAEIRRGARKKAQQMRMSNWVPGMNRPRIVAPNITSSALLRNRHKDTPMVCIGNSWSLNLLDMEKVTRFKTIGCNRILRLLQPDYYIVVDRAPYVQDARLIREFKGVRVLSSTIYDEKVVCHRVPLQPVPDFDFYDFRAACTRAPIGNGIRGLGGTRFPIVQLDWSRPVASWGNIAGPMFQLAVMMGANPIGICGVDLIWKSKDKSHFFGNGSKVGCFPFSIHHLMRFFHATAQWCEKNHIKVFNLSPEGILDCFERISEQEFHSRFGEYADGSRVYPREQFEFGFCPNGRSGPQRAHHRNQSHLAALSGGVSAGLGSARHGSRSGTHQEARARAAAAQKLRRHRPMVP